jgi:hypothetical protein
MHDVTWSLIAVLVSLNVAALVGQTVTIDSTRIKPARSRQSIPRDGTAGVGRLGLQAWIRWPPHQRFR